MKIFDYVEPPFPPYQPGQSKKLAEIAVAALIFVVPTLVLFILAK